MKNIKSKSADFQVDVDGVSTDLYFLSNSNGMEMAVTNFGARVVECWVPDRNGNFADVVLGHYHINDYIHFKGERFLGAAIGRFGNRIANSRFKLGGQNYQLPVNDGHNSLHGGFKGFDMVVWETEQVSEQKIVFSHFSKDGEEGYPGNLSVWMSYELNDENEFRIQYEARTDQTTVINLTHHSFFNLLGEGKGTINNHHLFINAKYYTPIDQNLIPTGEILTVEGTPMDFNKPSPVSSRLAENFGQLNLAKGYDHNWVINRASLSGVELAASLYEPESGRFMEVFTSQPGIQFYGGNFFDGQTSGKSGAAYGYRECLALETQHFPDSPNHPHFPSTVLHPDSKYEETCIYRFSVK